MAFCTACGGNVAGAFCSQCGQPASAAAPGVSTPPPPPPVYAQPGYGQPVPVATSRKTSPVVWILVIVLGLFVLGGIAVFSVIGYVAHKARQAGIVDIGRGGIVLQGDGSDGKNARIQIGGGNAKLPSWVPAYPGADPKASITGIGDDGEGGNFSFTTPDSPAKVKAFYQDKCKELGLKVNLETSTDEGGMFVAAEENGEHRVLTVVIAGEKNGESTINVTYARKKG